MIGEFNLRTSYNLPSCFSIRLSASLSLHCDTVSPRVVALLLPILANEKFSWNGIIYFKKYSILQQQ